MPNYPKLSGILKRLLFDRDIKATDLAREVNLAQPTIHRFVSGKATRPHKSSLKPIADYFNITVDQLLGVEPLEDKKNNITRNGFIYIPLIKWNDLDNFNSNDDNHNNKDWIIVQNKISKNAFATTMPDSSMTPLFKQGTTLIFDPTITSSDRSFVLAKIGENNVFVVRQLLIDVNHQYLKPINHDLNQFQMRLLTPIDKIIGKLVESRNTFLNDNLLQIGEIE